MTTPASPSKFIESVWTSADDQISSQYRLSVIASSQVKGLTGGSNIESTSANSWIFRLDKSFTIPTQTANTYETYFNGLKIPRIGGKEETDKKIKLDFRSDQASDIYTFFKGWLDTGFNPINASMGSEASYRKDCNIKLELLSRGVAKVSPFATAEVAKTFTFYHVQPFEVNLTELSHENGDPVRVEIQFIYLYYEVGATAGSSTPSTPK